MIKKKKLQKQKHQLGNSEASNNIEGQCSSLWKGGGSLLSVGYLLSEFGDNAPRDGVGFAVGQHGRQSGSQRQGKQEEGQIRKHLEHTFSPNVYFLALPARYLLIVTWNSRGKNVIVGHRTLQHTHSVAKIRVDKHVYSSII